VETLRDVEPHRRPRRQRRWIERSEASRTPKFSATTVETW